MSILWLNLCPPEFPLGWTGQVWLLESVYLLGFQTDLGLRSPLPPTFLRSMKESSRVSLHQAVPLCLDNGTCHTAPQCTLCPLQQTLGKDPPRHSLHCVPDAWQVTPTLGRERGTGRGETGGFLSFLLDSLPSFWLS